MIKSCSKCGIKYNPKERGIVCPICKDKLIKENRKKIHLEEKLRPKRNYTNLTNKQ